MTLQADLLPLLHKMEASASDSEVLGHYLSLENTLKGATLSDRDADDLNKTLNSIRLRRATTGRLPSARSVLLSGPKE